MSSFHTFAVCVYKESPYLEECIKSLVNQTEKSNIIMCTSTPGDYSREIARRYGVPYLVRDGKSGIHDDWMFAWEQADSIFVTIAHQDDIYRKNYVEELMKANLKYDDISLFAGDYITLKMTGDEKSGRLKAKREFFNKVWMVKKLLRAPYLWKSACDIPFVKKAGLMFGNSICCPTCTYNKSKLGNSMFESEYTFVLDWDNLISLAERPGRFYITEKPVIAYRVHEESETKACIEDDRRPSEEMAMFRKLWPEWISALLMKYYKKAYSEYED